MITFRWIATFLLAIYCSILAVHNLKIGAFNAAVFGQQKARKQRVLGIIAKIAVCYDILLLQEVRDATETAVNKLLNRIKKDFGVNFDLVSSERLGRSHSKEQYVFLYRKDRGIDVTSSYHYDDGDESFKNDTFEREPFIVKFRAENSEVADFALVAIHIKPKKAYEELKALNDVYLDVKNRLSRNIIILGDLNADCTYMPKKYWSDIDLRQNTELWWPIGDDMDTTTSRTHCAYDRFIIAGRLRKAVLQESVGIFDFATVLGLSLEEAREVSDHYPIELELREKTARTTRSSPKCQGAYLGMKVRQSS
ncbi:deoxyribonuclease-1-like isoform X2 [Pomacea canaliculata]|uniref:deoxyribonuclease-1-like isoform X2 n=1 Tax=Pomacea canaliculata TaxID=400727 RepID=UPI000D729371|nr:deoxyribonuclease-1-like isoform X2 [Pomacea canaliculata]